MSHNAGSWMGGRPGDESVFVTGAFGGGHSVFASEHTLFISEGLVASPREEPTLFSLNRQQLGSN
jgi:hypothetical protein